MKEIIYNRKGRIEWVDGATCDCIRRGRERVLITSCFVLLNFAIFVIFANRIGVLLKNTSEKATHWLLSRWHN